MGNLFRCQILTSDKCELCQIYSEDPLHAFWTCKEVEDVWRSFNCLHQPSSLRPLDFSDLLNRFLQVHDDYQKEIFTISAWFLWNRRNAIHFGRTTHPTAIILSLAGSLLQDFLAAQDVDPVAPRPPISHQCAH